MVSVVNKWKDDDPVFTELEYKNADADLADLDVLLVESPWLSPCALEEFVHLTLEIGDERLVRGRVDVRVQNFVVGSRWCKAGDAETFEHFVGVAPVAFLSKADADKPTTPGNGSAGSWMSFRP